MYRLSKYPDTEKLITSKYDVCKFKENWMRFTVNEQGFETETPSIPPPITTNAMITIAPVLRGNFFSFISRLDGRTACLPLRTSLAKALFLTLMSCNVPGFQ